MAVRYADEPGAAARAVAAAYHAGAGAGLVDEDEAARIKAGLGCSPAFARFDHVGALLLAGVQDFLKLSLCRAKNRHSDTRLVVILRSPSTAQNSSSVRSGCSPAKASSSAWWSS